MDSNLKNYLDKHGVKYVVHEHEAVFTVEESKKLKKDIPGMHCKTLFLKDSNGEFYLVGLRADKRLDMKKLRGYLGVRKLHFASEEELLDKVRLKPGSVSIFGAVNVKNHDVKLILDKEVWDASIVGFHPNLNTATLELRHVDLEKYYNSLGIDKEIIEL